VDFDRLVAAGRAAGLQEVSFGPQSNYLMRLVDPAGLDEAPLPERLQLKNLLFGIGETMRVLEMRKA